MRKLTRRGWWGAGALLVALGAAMAAAPTVGAQEDGKTTWLGVYTQSINDNLRDALNYSGRGVLVNRVVSGSPADEAGIEKRDVITRFNSRQVDDPEELASFVRNARSGQRVSLQIVRDGDRKTLRVTLGSRDRGRSGHRNWSWSDDDGDRVWIEEHDEDGEHGRHAPRVRIKRHGDGVDGDFDVHMPDLSHLRELGGHFRTMFSNRGRLGVQVQDMNDDLSGYFGNSKGALVLEVMDDSPAKKAGIKAGDVITGVGGESVSDVESLVDAIREAGEGEVDVKVVRKGRTQTLRADIESNPHAYYFRDGNDRDRRVIRERAHRDRDRARRMRDEVREDRRDVQREVEELRRELRELTRKLERLGRED